uniref:Secreted protein n=1 Tax=Haemonchus contortus TaxID=6289 RepID=A0A7I5E9Q8_HAECO
MISRIYCLLCLIFILSAVPNATSQEVELYKRRIGMGCDYQIWSTSNHWFENDE